jgi:hypothetical protein
MLPANGTIFLEMKLIANESARNWVTPQQDADLEQRKVTKIRAHEHRQKL